MAQKPQDDTAHIASIVGTGCRATRARMHARRITRAYDAALAPTGLKSTEYALLTAVAFLENGRMHLLAEKLDMDLSTLSRGVAGLGRKGLVEVEQLGHRNRRVHLTAKGKQLLTMGFPLWQAAQDKELEREAAAG